uniref:Uncharacterized protein n=1 Tax=Photinus pyralis TaxID=7054 RepID=A0A1Y1M826_PHOPY
MYLSKTPAHYAHVNECQLKSGRCACYHRVCERTDCKVLKSSSFSRYHEERTHHALPLPHTTSRRYLRLGFNFRVIDTIIVKVFHSTNRQGNSLLTVLTEKIWVIKGTISINLRMKGIN